MLEELNCKEKLYQQVMALKILQCGDPFRYGVNVVDFVRSLGVTVELLPFTTPGLRGMAIPGADGTKEKDIILLNSERDVYQRNFDCAHEMMHLALHTHKDHKSFVCSDKIIPNQNSFYEWQANEGAAEYCVPYCALLMAIKILYPNIKRCNLAQLDSMRSSLSHIFMVPEVVIHNRVESLKYEIYQYVHLGVKLERIKLMSRNEQLKRKINVMSIYEEVLSRYANDMTVK